MAESIFLSAGHGGMDPGATAFGLREKNINLRIMLAYRDELVRHGVKVFTSRTTDVNDAVDDEVREAIASGVDLAVSFHTNAGGGDGFEAYCNTDNADGVRLCRLAEKHVKALGQNSRGIKDGVHPGSRWNKTGFCTSYNYPDSVETDLRKENKIKGCICTSFLVVSIILRLFS